MKGITFPKDYKKYMTISEVEAAKAMIAEQKEDEETAAGWAEYAVREALKDTGDYLVRVIEAKERSTETAVFGTHTIPIPGNLISGLMQQPEQKWASSSSGLIYLTSGSLVRHRTNSTCGSDTSRSRKETENNC